MKNLPKVNEKNVFDIKSDNVKVVNHKKMFAVKLLTNSVVTSNCYIALNMFEHIFRFHITHTNRCIML